MKCSVIILNWNGEKMLRRYLPSVIAHTPKDDVEVVVADNGSTDGSVAWLKTQPVRVILLDKNYGFAEGYNRAIAQVEAEYVVLLNSDVEVTANWLAPLLQCLADNADTVAVQPKVLSWQSKEDYLAGKADAIAFEHAGAAGGMIDALGYPYCRGRFLTCVEKDHGQYDTAAQVFWTSGACMVIRKRIYEEAGGLDGYFFAHQEEIDLCWRLQSRGWKMMCVPQSAVYHLGAGTLSYESPRKTYLNFRNNLLMLYKNLGNKYLYPVMFVRFFLDYVAAAQMLVQGRVANFKAVVQARRDYHAAKKRYMSVRQAIQKEAKTEYVGIISRRSIIFDHYLLRKNK